MPAERRAILVLRVSGAAVLVLSIVMLAIFPVVLVVIAVVRAGVIRMLGWK